MEALVDLGRILSAKGRLRTLVLQALLSRRRRAAARWLRETRRRLLGQPHSVSAFLQLDDPYSYLLAHYLPSLAAHYDIDLHLFLSESRGDEYQPAPDLLAEYAAMDCRRLARELDIPFLDKGTSPPVEHRLAMLDAIAARSGEQDFDEEFLRALSVFWRGDAEAASRRSAAPNGDGRADMLIAESRERRNRLGHYGSAMLHYAGEWYWGIDRLHYLCERLDDLGAMREATQDRSLASLKQSMQFTLPVAPPTRAEHLPPLELFFSFRSPYSYLALAPVYEIADAFGLALKIRPVLPMVMRGLKVPTQKLRYIVQDAAREAVRRGAGFGRIADPVGAGAERCLAVFFHAESVNCGRAFALNASEAIWCGAVDVASDRGMREITDRTGLSWPAAKAAMDGDDWRETVGENRKSMMESGVWGVPTLRLGEFVAWGQDRDWLLVRHLEELCNTGDGILV